MKLLLALYVALMSAATGWAAQLEPAGSVDASAVTKQALPLTAHFSILEDKSGQLTLADVQQPQVAARFTPSGDVGESMNLGFSRSAYWLRLRLRNPSAQPLERLLEIGYARLGSIELHAPQADGRYEGVKTGITMPFASRPHAHRFFVFPLTLPAGSDQLLYLRVQSTSSLLIPARLWAPHAFRAYERQDYSAQAWYFGMASAMVLFNLLLFLALRDRNYLLYVGFVASNALALAAENGLGDEFLWGNSPRWSLIASMVGYSFAIGFFVLFMRRMLGTAELTPRVDRLLQGLAASLLLSPIALALSFRTVILPLILLYLVTVMFCLSIGAFYSLRRQRSAYFFLVAFAILGIGASAYALRTLGVLPTNVFTQNGMQIGSALEMLLLAFALADRYNVLRHEKESAQEQALQAQRQLVDSLRLSERMLEERVAQRTDELLQLNHQLEALSATDGLTGVANRRRFDEMLAAEWARASRLAQPLALIMIDVDWFKNYNDHYGHQVGDACLQKVARAIASTACRPGDIVARYGGEEFAVIAPATSGPAALSLARRVCLALEELAEPHATSEFGLVTLSMGVAAVTPEAAANPGSLVAAADAALYSAKTLGRNQAVLV